jgi:hypothetical protein
MNRKLKLGVFGDSFADLNPVEYQDPITNRFPWPIHLAELLDVELSCYAASGTSQWWSYKRFLQHYEELDIIIFVYTEYNRWATISGGPDGSFERLASLVDKNRLPFMDSVTRTVGKQLLDVHPYLFDEQFNLFTYQNIYNEVTHRCRSASKQLVNILAFDDTYSDELPIHLDDQTVTLTGLARVSHTEIEASSRLEEMTSNSIDVRHCHMNPYNNIILAQLISESIGTKGVRRKIWEDTRFSYDESHIEYIIK